MSEHELRRVDLNLLAILQTLLETRSVGRTAQRLGMSQPAVSRALAALRGVFNDALLVKARGTMQPTMRAMELSEPLGNVLAAISTLLHPPETFNPATAQRVFRVATTDYGATVVLPPLFEQLQGLGPGVAIEVVPFDRQTFERLGSGGLDLLLYSDNPVPGSLRARDLYQESFRCLLRQGHPILAGAQDGRLTLDDFLACSHILVTVVGGRTGPVDARLAEIGRERRIALWLPYFATAALVAARSDLILTMPRRAAQTFADLAKLVMLEPPLELGQFGYRLVWHERVHGDPANAWLRRTILDATSE